MTHMHVPTVPTARDMRKAAAQGRHRLAIKGKHRVEVSLAQCSGHTPQAHGYDGPNPCPVHAPDAYALLGATHVYSIRDVLGDPYAVYHRINSVSLEAAAGLGYAYTAGNMQFYTNHQEFVGMYVDVDL